MESVRGNDQGKKKMGGGSVSIGGTSSSGGGCFKLNVHAPEFIPRSFTQIPVSGYYYPYSQYQDWIYVGDQDSFPFFDNKNVVLPQDHRKDDLPEEVRLKIIKQVEYQLSDMSLLANENLAKQMSKDPEAYVPITSVASTKKIKSLLSNKPMQVLAQALRSSSKLNVSNDGKKVKRKQPFTDKDKEELQVNESWHFDLLVKMVCFASPIVCLKRFSSFLKSRTVVAENLPDDHSHHNIEKIFNVVGSVKTIRVCHPQDSNSSASKGEHFISNKLHALIEFESPEIAEKAVERLNDEKNWRKGLRVKMLLRRSPKSVLKNRKSDFDGYLDDDELAEDASQPIQPEPANDTNNIAEESSTASKKGWGKGRVKLRQQQSLSYSARGLLSASPQSNCHIQSEGPAKPIVKVPRMPDGTRGFTMGRGKPLGAAAPSSLSCVV
ncbi:la-related protein 6C-like isoform X1 [Ipomoea triloba]|uniref:la-related protein 6C-like isoform X1 n=1 Tax=Ipomoea triloba TaxID=35885 RepID=UPI00125DC985|nr:la-related protein 6C-like isoform X1 [Ipomoea triloba]